MRLVGKRQIGELQLSELITTLMLSELAVMPLADSSIPLSHALVPISVLLLLEVFISSLTCRSLFLRKIFYGTPSILICRGRLNEKELKRLRMDMNELLSELRLKDINRLSEVQYAILEDNGQLSVFCTDTEEGGAAGLDFPILINGQIPYRAMEYAGVTESWLRKQLSHLHLSQKDVLLMTVDDTKQITYILKDSPDGRIRTKDSR